MVIGEYGLVVRVDNFDAIEQEVGQALATQYETNVVRYAQRICGREARVNSLGRGRLVIGWGRLSRERFIQCELEHRLVYASELIADLGAAVSVPGCGVSPSLSADWQSPLCLPSDVADPWLQARVSEDIHLAFGVYGAVSVGRLQLWRQPICHVHAQQRVLYGECLARLGDGQGGISMEPGEFIPGLERIGLMRCLDRSVFQLALRFMEVDSALQLGVNVSGQSAIDDVWWGSTFRLLEARPDIASRLAVEITETARLQSGLGRQFCRRLQHLGCRVVIDDFGAGFGVESSLEIRSPDVIKIDGRILRIAAEEDSEQRLELMVRMAKELAPLVVVEGVESARDLRLVEAAGAVWAQGYHLGEPRALGFGKSDMPTSTQSSGLVADAKAI